MEDMNEARRDYLDKELPGLQCSKCYRVFIIGREIPRNARYCPNCGDTLFACTYTECQLVKMGHYGPCVIATAVLGNSAEYELNTLRSYRDRMAQYRLGSLFRCWYERIKRPVAAYIRDKHWHKQVMLRLFIQPSLALQSSRKTSSFPKLLDLVMLPIYGALLLWASLVYLLVALHKKWG